MTSLLVGVVLAMPVGALDRGIRFKHLSLEEGLSQNTVHSIVQDALGFVWFGTQDGLNRWDGYELEIYRHDPQDPSSLPQGSISSLVADPSGDLWIGTEGGGLARWNRRTDTFARWQHDPSNAASLAGNQVRAMIRDAEGGLWIGTFADGVDRFDPQSQIFTHYRNQPADPSSLVDNRIRSLDFDRKGDLWISTLGGLDRFDRDQRRFIHHLSALDGDTAVSVLSVVEDSDGYVWAGTLEQGLIRIDPHGAGYLRFEHDAADPHSLSGNRVRVVFVDSADRLWVGTDSGLDLFDPGSGTFARYEHDLANPDGLSASRIASMYEDRGGVLWVGTQGGGVNWWNPIAWSFAHYGQRAGDPSGLSSNAIMAFADDPAAGEVWIGTLGGGLNRWNRGTDEITIFRHSQDDSSSLGDDRVMSLLNDTRGTLWVGTLAAGLDRFDPSTRGFVHYRHDPDDPRSLPADGVMEIFEDSAGRLWLGTFGGGLSRFDAESGSFVNFAYSGDDSSSLGDDRAGSIVEDAFGKLWIGTHGGGLSRFDPATQRFSQFRHDADNSSSLSTDRIYALHIDTSGKLLIGTAGGGLARLDRLDVEPGEESFRTFTDRDGLPNTTINGIHSDSDGHVWVSTNRGLSRFDPLTETFTNYDTLHGLQSLEFNVGAHHASATGELFFGGFAGFNAFFPEAVETNEYAPALIITSAATGGGELDVRAAGSIELGPRDAYLALEVSALDFTAPSRNRYAYKLEGRSDEWIDLGHNRNVTLAGLDPGTYQLRIRGSNNEGVWSEENLGVEVHVAPPPWRSGLAYTIYALVLGAGGLTYVRTQSDERRRQYEHSRGLEKVVALTEKNLQAERQRATKLESLGILAGGIAHDFNNLLMGISGNIELARHSLVKPEKLATYLDGAGEATKQASQLARQLVTFAKGGKPVKKVMGIEPVVREAANLALAGSKAECVFVVSDADLCASIDAGQLNQVIQNLVINADQAMPGGGRVEIRIEKVEVSTGELAAVRSGRYLRVSISDTGDGIPEEILDRVFDPYFTTKSTGTGLGLATSYSIAKNHGGLLRAHSVKGQGATFEVLIPAADDPPAEQPRKSRGFTESVSSGAVLLMDDDQTVLRSIEKMLECVGYHVHSVLDGEHAISAFEQAERSGQPFDLVILDLTVRGGIGGCEVLAALKKINPGVKAIVSSGYSDDAVMSDPESHGFCGVLQKPFQLRELGRVVRSVSRMGSETETATTPEKATTSLGDDANPTIN